ncbi:GntR family transcriptional regulator [Pigmentiphaga soli]|uniref:GntR family transcriptional regulator n=1 Tax=Pigmentiphaga soli TaxID=1007095 RepID=A0ABP8HP15_9BURK
MKRERRILSAGEPAFASRKSVGDDVYDVLLSYLISLKIAPGARIPIDQLSRELNVSQTPIRAALIRLESEGLVVKTHLVGFSAASMPTPGRFAEIYQVRRLLEPYAASRAALTLSKAKLSELDALHDAMRRPGGRDARLAYGKFATTDAKFHALIAREGGGELLAGILGKLHTHMHLFRILFHSQVTEAAIAEHGAIMAALHAGDEAAAGRAMEQHINLSYQRVAPILEALPDLE